MTEQQHIYLDFAKRLRRGLDAVLMIRTLIVGYLFALRS